MSLLSLTEPLEFIPSCRMIEKNIPEVCFAAMLADELTDGLTLTLKDGVYHKRLNTSRERVGKLLNKISATHYLIATANSTKEEEYAENCKMVEAGWELVAPAGMCTSPHSPLREADCPYMFCLYGYPKGGDYQPGLHKLPALPEDLERVTPKQQHLMDDYFQSYFHTALGASNQ